MADYSNISVNAQSSIRIEGSKVIYFDPFRVEEDRKDADVIFVTHEHYDHFEPDSIKKLLKADTILVAPESMKAEVLKKSGVSEKNCVFYVPNESYELDGLKIETVPAYNKLKPFHPKWNKWLGYIVELDGTRYYVAGDTDVNADILKVKCDVALIPIGGHYTMDKKQAAEYILELKPTAVIPTHYGTLIGSPEDGADLKKIVEEKDSSIEVVLKL